MEMHVFQTIQQLVRVPLGRHRALDLEEMTDAEPPLREELFSSTQLESHARSLAGTHELDPRPGPELLLRRLGENEEVIGKSYEDVAEAIRRGRPVAPAAEWLLDNYYLIEEEIDQIRLHFPPGYSRHLPRLGSGPLRGFPRVYDLALELVSHTDGRVDIENLSHFLQSYQAVHHLRLGELWAMPIMVGLALIENLRRVSFRIAWRRRQRDLGMNWSQQFIQVAQKKPKSLITVLGDFVRSHPPLSAPFLAELTGNLQGTYPALGLVVNWIEQELSERGQTPEMIQQAESHNQAADHVSIANCITSLRNLSTIEWRDFVESLSVMEAVLHRDPQGVHAQMDFRSRDLCRRIVEGLARQSRQDEEAVAEVVVRLAAERLRRPGTDPREGTVSYFLLGEGRPELEVQAHYRAGLRLRMRRFLDRHTLWPYLLAIGVLTALVSAAIFRLVEQGPHWVWFAFAITAIALVASRSAVSLVNWAATLLVPPRGLPRLDFSKGIPSTHRTAVVVPAFLSSMGTVARLLEQLEIRYLANRSPNLMMVLLTDFPDAPKETMPEDQPLLEAAVAGIRALNRKYVEGGQTVFHLLHRPRLWNPAAQCWMGYERKRGKVEQFNRLIREGLTDPFTVLEGDVQGLQSIRYVIVLDADTELPPQSAWQMVGALAHPLNRPRIDPRRRCVEEGYGVLQPRLAVGLPASQRSRFARLFAGDAGLDPYTREVSNVYQDLFGEGQFMGKGIYDVAAFDAAVGGRFPENRILSHDLIEGCHARCGYLNDVELIENHPLRYLADVGRRRRWARGDWQIARWLLPRVPGPGGTRRPNPLGALAKWMILDNLRRTLVPLALFAALLLGWFGTPDAAAVWTLLLVTVFFLPDLARTLRALSVKPRELHWSTHLRHAGRKELRMWAIDLLDLLLVPFHAFMYLETILRTGYRLLISHRRLLEWRTASETEKSVRTTLAGTFAAMWPAPVAAAAVAALVAAKALPIIAGALVSLWQYLPPPGGFTAVAVIFPFLAGWFLSPAIVWFLGRSASRRMPVITEDQKLFLRGIARRTWAFFEHLVGPEHHWLPPDNFQEKPPLGSADRTSPTNMGMALLGDLAAHDFGYVSAGALIERTGQTFQTMEELPRHRGHFYNWYNTLTLQPCPIRYISTADSGNLAVAMITLEAGLAELAVRPILPERWREGLQDTAQILLEELGRAPSARSQAAGTAGLHRIRETVAEQTAALASVPDTMPGIYRALSAFASAVSQLDGLVDDGDEPAFWLHALRRQCEDLRDDLAYLAPWLDRAQDQEEILEAIPSLDKIPSLLELARLADRRQAVDAPTGAVRSENPSIRTLPGDPLLLAAERAAHRLAALENLQTRCGELSEMDLGFLYDSRRNLLAIGYNPETHRQDPGHYDLLASEARLCSFLGVARGQLPLEHWFHLGRQLAPGGGSAVLVSWSGSMFEYLMPLVVMPAYEATLLQESCRGVVRRQIRHGLRHGMPWGFSESCYNQIDVQGSYQYRAFGVPGLGLKRGLGDDLVVSPYASALALMIDPRNACCNLRAMAELGFVGRYGFYEAADYTANRVPRGEKFALVRTHMAHHSGMTLLALAYALLDQPMQQRFLSDSQIRASLLLLQERIPVAQVRTRIGMVPEGPEPRAAQGPSQIALRSFTGTDSPVPEVYLLSNGRYHVLITAAGSGSSRWENLALTRWREDATRDHWGTFLYIRDLDSGSVWSATGQPTCAEFDRYEVTFSQGVAEFQSVRHKVKAQTRVAVSPEDDVELRRLAITNLSDRIRNLEITSYAEVVILNGPDACEQPAFHGLFVETQTVPEKAAILCTRRSKSSEETWPWFFHGMVVHEAPVAEGVSFETDRSRFLGRCRTAADPVAMEQTGPLSGTCGPVLDPVMAIRRTIRLAPGESVTVDATWGVAQDRPKALSLVDKHCDHHLADRVFELAWMHSQVLPYQLRATEADAQLFARMAGSLLYANPCLRARASLMARNRKTQTSLWSYGISGDLPIVLLRVSDQSGLELVRQVIQAHAYWRHKGLQADLVILTEAYAGYRQSLLDAIIGLVQAGPEAKVLDQPAGIFVRNIDQVSEDDRLLFQAVSRIVLGDRMGTLVEQLERHVLPELDVPPFRPTREPEGAVPGDKDLPHRELLFFNGWGGFSTDGREYVILLRPGLVTPAPWVNVLANPSFGSVISESGAAYTWYQNAHEFRLTPWYNDPISDVSGEAFYIRDEDSGTFWSPTPGPARGTTAYVSRHGLGYSAFEHTQDRIFTEVFTYVAMEAPLKFTAIKVRNLSNRKRRLSLTGFVEWVLGESRERHSMHVVTRLDPQSGAIFAWNPYKPDFSAAVAFFHCSHSQRTLTTHRTEFLGRNGSPAAPAAMRRVGLSNRAGGGVDPCAAIQAYVEVPPGEQGEVVFVLGSAGGEQQARSLLAQWGGVDGARRALEEVWQFWKHNLGGIYVETPDPSVDFLVNHWLLYQAWACRFWGRSGYYQSGGAYGFRDQLQDSMAFLYECPWLTRQHLLTCSSRQFQDGDVQHWWHPPSGHGVRTRISDDYLWLPYVVCRYVTVTGDTGVLDEQTPFLEAPQLDPAVDSQYGLPRVSDRQATLYEHCVRALNHGLRYGPHGLPLMGCGDWNDGMNRVGREGSGESVWLAFFLYDTLRSFADLAQGHGNDDYARKCRTEADRLREKIEANTWDGRWYLRAFFDDGRPLGSSQNDQCQIDLLPQAWAVLSGAADPLRAEQALQAALDRLVDPDARLIRLFAPPFDGTLLDPGYIRGYVPGVRENGGQYTHAALWAVIAVARLRHTEKAWQLFSLLNPIRHADSPERAAAYKVEPYVVAADIYSAKGQEGRGGWTWYTGSAGWMYRLLVEDLLGLRLQADVLSFSPLLPAEWDGCTLHYRYRDTIYHIRIVKEGSQTWNVRRVLLDNVEQDDKRIHLTDDRLEHRATVEVGQPPAGIGQ
jgi:cellobiose phosphorylase